MSPISEVDDEGINEFNSILVSQSEKINLNIDNSESSGSGGLVEEVPLPSTWTAVLQALSADPQFASLSLAQLNKGVFFF